MEGFPSGSDSKESACNAGDPGQSPGREDLLEEEWQPTFVFLPGKSHGQRSLTATIHGLANSQIQRKQLTHLRYSSQAPGSTANSTVRRRKMAQEPWSPLPAAPSTGLGRWRRPSLVQRHSWESWEYELKHGSKKALESKFLCPRGASRNVRNWKRGMHASVCSG